MLLLVFKMWRLKLISLISEFSLVLSEATWRWQGWNMLGFIYIVANSTKTCF